MWSGIFHYIGGALKYAGAAIVLVFSISLSYTFFSQIAPPDMIWFVWAALGLTEIGLLIWIAVFRMQRHHDAHKAIAFVMVLVCMAAVLYTDAMELANLFHLTTLVSGLYYYALIVLLLIHFGAFALDEFIKESEKFDRQHGNLIANPNQYGNLTGELNRPLALNRPKEEAANTREMEALSYTQETETNGNAMNLSQVGQAVKEGVSSVTKKVKASMSNGKQGDRVRGNGRTNTSENTSLPDTQTAPAPAPAIEIIPIEKLRGE